MGSFIIYTLILLVSIVYSKQCENELEKAFVTKTKVYDYLDSSGWQILNAKFGVKTGDLYYQAHFKQVSKKEHKTVIGREGVAKDKKWVKVFENRPNYHQFLIDQNEKYLYFTTQRKNITLLAKIDTKNGNPLKQIILSNYYDCNKVDCRLVLSPDGKNIYYFSYRNGEKNFICRANLPDGGSTLCAWNDRGIRNIDLSILESPTQMLLSSANQCSNRYADCFTRYRKISFKNKFISVEWVKQLNYKNDNYYSSTTNSDSPLSKSIYLDDESVIFLLHGSYSKWYLQQLNSTTGFEILSKSVMIKNTFKFGEHQISDVVIAKGTIYSEDRLIYSLTKPTHAKHAILVVYYQKETFELYLPNQKIKLNSLLYDFYTDQLYMFGFYNK